MLLNSVTLVCGLLALVGQLQAQKVFDVEEMEELDVDEVLQSLNSLQEIASTEAGAEKVAKILALAKDKDETEFAGQKIQDLVDLNKLEISACLKSEMDQRQAICRNDSGESEILIQYCASCMKALMEFCTDRPIGNLVDRYLKGRVNAMRSILKKSAKIIRFIREKKGLEQEMEGEESGDIYLDEGLVEEFFLKHPSDSDEFALAFMKRDCQEILNGIKLELLHLIDENSVIFYLDTKYSGGTLAMLHCKIVLDKYNDSELTGSKTD